MYIFQFSDDVLDENDQIVPTLNDVRQDDVTPSNSNLSEGPNFSLARKKRQVRHTQPKAAKLKIKVNHIKKNFFFAYWFILTI